MRSIFELHQRISVGGPSLSDLAPVPREILRADRASDGGGPRPGSAAYFLRAIDTKSCHIMAIDTLYSVI